MYRMVWPGRAVQEHAAEEYGLRVEIDGDDDLGRRLLIAWDAPFSKYTDEATEWSRPVALHTDPELDVAVFQRPLHCKYAPTFRLLKEAGVKVIVDVDDNFDVIDPANVAWHASAEHWMRDYEVNAYAERFGKVIITRKTNNGWKFVPSHLGSMNRLHWRAALKEADLVTCSTSALANHIRRYNRNVEVIDNYVTDILEHEEGERPVVGWTGSIATHPRDLPEIGGGLLYAKRSNDFTFKIVGTGSGVKEFTGVEPDETTGWVDIEDYHGAYGTLDVALCPLNDSAFNRSKSRLKALEAASVGAVPVMSPLPEYTRIHDEGVGFIARRSRDWGHLIRQLVSDDVLRKDMRDVGYDVASRNTLRGNAWRWAEIWRDV